MKTLLISKLHGHFSLENDTNILTPNNHFSSTNSTDILTHSETPLSLENTKDIFKFNFLLLYLDKFYQSNYSNTIRLTEEGHLLFIITDCSKDAVGLFWQHLTVEFFQDRLCFIYPASFLALDAHGKYLWLISKAWLKKIYQYLYEKHLISLVMIMFQNENLI